MPVGDVDARLLALIGVIVDDLGCDGHQVHPAGTACDRLVLVDVLTKFLQPTLMLLEHRHYPTSWPSGVSRARRRFSHRAPPVFRH